MAEIVDNLRVAIIVDEAGAGRGDLSVKYQITTGHRGGSSVVLVVTAGRCMIPDSTGP